MSPEIPQLQPSTVQQIASSKNSAIPVLQQQKLPTSDNRKAGTSAADTVAIDSVKEVRGEKLQRIEGAMTDKRNLATAIRQTDTALDVASTRIQAMKDNLAKIVKNYPPFNIDSKERMDILRSFISLRKEIDSMTIPAPPPQPGVQFKSEIWQGEGLAALLPGELTLSSSDAQVSSAHDQLDNTVQVISEGKQELRQTLFSKG